MKHFIQQNKDTYNRIARHFSSTREYLWEDLRPLRDFAHDGDRILDLGCGNGRLYQLFTGLSIDYRGADQSEELLRFAREKFPDVPFDQVEMSELPYTDASFDHIFCIAAFQHMPTRELRLQTLREMKRVLVPGGRIIMTNWNLYSTTAKKKWNAEFAPGDFIIPWKDGATGETVAERYYHGFTEDELLSLAAESGLIVEEQYFSRKGMKATVEDATSIISIFSPSLPRRG